MIRILSLTDAGRCLGLKLKALIESGSGANDVVCEFKPQPFSQTVQKAFTDKDKLILICATGIAVRSIASVVEDKRTDPPVLVLDEKGDFVIPLLSGHEGGANEWARQISDLLDAQLVITTAADYTNPIYTVGMGCERDCSSEELDALLIQSLAAKDIKLDQIKSIHSIDIKADEVGLIALAKKYGMEFKTYSVKELKQVEKQLATPSEYVFKTVGVYGVAESAALFSAQSLTGVAAELILNKQKSERATCAIACSYMK